MAQTVRERIEALRGRILELRLTVKKTATLVHAIDEEIRRTRHEKRRREQGLETVRPWPGAVLLYPRAG